MILLADHDVVGIVAALRRVLESPDWKEFAEVLELRFFTFDNVGLPPDAPDHVVWQAAQAEQAVLITANRSGGVESLEQTIQSFSEPDSLPVVTLADPQRILLDAEYAISAALRLLDYLEQLDTFRGVGRLYIP